MRPIGSMPQPVIVITGATSGIGREAARQLAAQGATLAILGRDFEKGMATLAELRQSAAHPDRLSFLACDLEKLDDVRSAAATLRERFGHIDVLIANAGAINPRRRDTPDGLEATLAVNHLAHFLLTGLLLDRLRAAAQGRIVVVSSEAHRAGRIRRNDLQWRRGYTRFRAYATSKLANLHFAFELARRLERTPVTVNAVNPGAALTGLSRSTGPMGTLATTLLKPFLVTPARAAETTVFAATSPRLATVTGRYFARRRQAPVAPQALDRNTAEWLWRQSETLTGFNWPEG